MLKNGALSGTTVLDLSRLLPGPFCSMILADHGARVISLEDKRFMADDFFITTVKWIRIHCLEIMPGEEKEEIVSFIRE